jgi:hypothetical protein
MGTRNLRFCEEESACFLSPLLLVACMLAMHVNAARFCVSALLCKQGRFERSPFLFGEGLELRFADFGEAVAFVPVCNEMFATVDDCMATCDDFYEGQHLPLDYKHL